MRMRMRRRRRRGRRIVIEIYGMLAMLMLNLWFLFDTLAIVQILDMTFSNEYLYEGDVTTGPRVGNFYQLTRQIHTPNE